MKLWQQISGVLTAMFLLAASAVADETVSETAAADEDISITAPEQDDGHAVDGTLIFTKRIARFCGLGSKDANSSQKIEDCLNSLLRLKYGSQLDKLETFGTIYNADYYQLNAEYLELALQKKSLAGNYEEEIDNAATTSSPTAYNKRALQEKDANLSALAIKNLAEIIDVMASSGNLHALNYISAYENASKTAAPVEREDDE